MRDMSDPPATNEAQTITRLLRAIAGGTDAKANQHDIIFRAAANLIDDLVRVNDELLKEQRDGNL